MNRIVRSEGTWSGKGFFNKQERYFDLNSWHSFTCAARSTAAFSLSRKFETEVLASKEEREAVLLLSAFLCACESRKGTSITTAGLFKGFLSLAL